MSLVDIPCHIVTLLLGLYKMVTWTILKIAQKPLKTKILEKMKAADIVPNGLKPWHAKIHDDAVYFRICYEKVLGIGESYMDGLWECEQLDEFVTRVVQAGLLAAITRNPLDRLADYLQFQFFNLQTDKRSWEVAEKHYDLGRALFESTLDPSMIYSCGYWKGAKNLAEAQKHKLEVLGRKLRLKKGMRVLDIGCGWGGVCKFLAETYGVTVVGITIGKEGAKVARDRCAGLPVDIRVHDYRDLDPMEKFDRIVCIEMFEHVGWRNHKTFMKMAQRHLVDDGLFFLHVIGIDSDEVPQADPWVMKYIWPNSYLPHMKDIAEAASNIFTIEDCENIGPFFDKTFMAWQQNFQENWSKIEHLFVEPTRFYRMWTFYLLVCAGMFRARRFQCWQMMFSKRLKGGYNSVR